MTYIRSLSAMLWKDFRIELRTGEVLLATVLFALLLLLVFVFALHPAALRAQGVLAGTLWAALFFAGAVGLSRGFARERAEGRLLGLMLTPVDRSAIFVGKVLVSFVFMSIVAAVTIPAFFAFFGQPVAAPVWRWMIVIGLVVLAFSGVGTLLSALAAQLRAGEVLYPVLLFPLLVPVILAAVHLTEELLVTGGWDTGGGWLQMLILYNLLFLGTPYLLFEYVVEV